MDYRDRVRAAAEWIAASRHLVAFTGAGISTESGLPDFRGPDGVWTRRDKGLPPPRSAAVVRPNRGHQALVELQDRGVLRFLISQNVDNLHLESGIRFDLLAELHGNTKRKRCTACSVTVPDGTPCCGRLVSSVVNFGDSLPDRDWSEAAAHSRRADVFLVVGSSLVVTPAAYLPKYALDAGARLILVNRGETPFDATAHLRFDESAGQVLSDIVQSMPG